MATSLREAAQQALRADVRPEEAITVNQRALIDKILARYSAEFTVFRELLQNADDAGATECELRFATNATVPHAHLPTHPNLSAKIADVSAPLTQWTFRNNGKPFNGDDWHRLRRIAEGNPDPERIGAFGVGFYSLFSICEEPIVVSGSGLMGFFWKGDLLFTRRAQAPQTDVSSTGVPWTTFLMSLREPTPFPESPLALTQFLATSLLFTANVGCVRLWIDDQLLCVLNKDLGAPQPVSPSRHLNGASPKRLLRVENMHATAVQIHVNVARLILVEAAEQAEREKPSEKSSLFATLSKSAGAGLTSMLSGALNGFGSKPASNSAQHSAGMHAKQLDFATQFELVACSLHLHILSALASVKADSQFAREIERSTKKPLPRSTPMQLVFMRKDEYDASITSSNLVSAEHSETDQHVRRVFAGLMPSFQTQGRVFIGFRTHQTTSFSGHMAARFIPTVERESLDFVDRYCAQWNTELLAIGGYVARVAYEAEIQRLGTMWMQSNDPQHHASILQAALHTMRYFSFAPSSPSSRVHTLMEDAFFQCCSRPCISLASTQGIQNSDRVRFPNAMLSEFVKDLPMIPTDHIELADRFVMQLKNRNLVQEITLDDVFTELSQRALSVDEMVACLRWWVMVAEHPSYDPSLRAKLLRNAMVSIQDSNEKQMPRIQGLSDVETVLQPNRVPTHVPLPPSCLVYEVSRHLRTSDLTAVFGWTELSLPVWLNYMLTMDKSPANEVRSQHGITQSPSNAEKILQTVAWAFANLNKAEREQVIQLLRHVPCIPTRQGMKPPQDAYFATVSLFADLPVITFPTIAIKGNVEKLLIALGVRQHVEIQLILDRLVAAGDWSAMDLMSYLAKHRDQLTEQEMHRLASTPLFPSEQKPSSDRHCASELYEPREELRKLGVPLLAWPGKAWRTNSEEAKLLYQLGLRRHPSLPEVLQLAASSPSAQRDCAAASLQYLLQKFSQVYAESYSLRVADAYAFVPTRAGQLVKPSEAFTDAAVATMQFHVAAVASLDAVKLQLPTHPPGSELVARILASPPPDEESARKVFIFLASCRTLKRNDLQTLSEAPIIPIAATADRASSYAAPRNCYFWPTNNVAPAYQAIFHYIDFGPSAAVFLRACGVSDEPSVEELVTKLIQDPVKFSELCRSTDAYMNVLRRIGENLPSLSKKLITSMKVSPILLGARKAATEQADDPTTNQEYALRRPNEVVIVDDAHAHMLFGSEIYAAPPDDALEAQLYEPLGAPRLSSLVTEAYAVANDVRPNTPRTREVLSTILERTPLFLFEKRANARKEIVREFEWLEQNLLVVEVGPPGIQLTRTLRYHRQEARDVQQCSAMAIIPTRSKQLVLHLAADMDVDWFEVALALSKFLLVRQPLQEVLLYMTVLSTPLRSLKRKGFHVDKMLAQQTAPTSSAIVPAPSTINMDNAVKELLQMFPAADPAYVHELLQTFSSEHLERASEVLLQNNYPRQSHNASDAKNDAPPGGWHEEQPQLPPVGTADRSPVAPPLPPKALQPKVPDGVMPPLDVSALQGAKGGLFQHWKNRFTQTGKLSSLADGTSSIQQTSNASPHDQNSLTVKADDSHVTPTANIRQHVQRAIQASRPEGSQVIQSQAQQREVRQAATNYCDVSGINTDLRLAGQVSGMNIYTSVELDPGKTLQNNQQALQRLVELIYRPIGQIFQLDPRSLHVFCDTKGPSIAFNRGGSIFLNLRYYLAWHDEDVLHNRLSAPLVSVYFSVAHELAHNLVADHNSEHEFYFSSIAEQHFVSLARYLAQVGCA
ncbi:hypothetical protein MYAM1_003577 [Malassezia yamatoensis]|uniref:Sacsin/Nov domain-containing protein n=1 Tax=Malassezia yamatoensis TaxID=253288 RepID=A0AAJ5YX02_9BASI|nr:hypothetical protein MYAM1_003577 [Malassezia yamatoensis]